VATVTARDETGKFRSLSPPEREAPLDATPIEIPPEIRAMLEQAFLHWPYGRVRPRPAAAELVPIFRALQSDPTPIDDPIGGGQFSLTAHGQLCYLPPPGHAWPYEERIVVK
jgi:hypothetical protein